MRILFFGTYRLWEQPRVRVLKEGLIELGHEIVECNVPLAFDTASRVRAARQPATSPLLALRVAQAWPRLWRAARRQPEPDVVLVPYLGHLDVHLGRRLWRRKPIVLDHYIFLRDTAADRGATSRAVLGTLDRVDRAAIAAADLIVVDTEGHRDLLPEERRADAVVVPIGTPQEWFRKPERRAGDPVKVVFFGIFTPLQGAPVIGEALRLLDPDPQQVRFTLAGRGQDLEETRRRAGSSPAVDWIDWVDSEELPALVSDHDVCLGIFGAGSKGLRVVPNKVFQGAAAGCAIVTSDSPPQRAALRDAAAFVPAGDPDGLAAELRNLTLDRDRIWALRQAAYQRATEAFAPRAVVRPLHERLEAGVVGRVS